MANITQLATDGKSLIHIPQPISNAVCSLTGTDIIWYLVIPLAIIALFMVFHRQIFALFGSKFNKTLAKAGYIKILFVKPNKRLIETKIRLDMYNNFEIGNFITKKVKNRKFNLDKLWDFCIGYDKDNLPVFMFDYNFVLPLKIEQVEIEKSIKKSLVEAGMEEAEIEKKINAVMLKIDSQVLHLVYKKKLISDLYSTVKDSDMRKTMLYVIGGIILLVILYYSGILYELLKYVGLDVASLKR